MTNYVIRRLLLIVPMLFGISLITFVVMHLAPGDPTSIRYGMQPEVSQSARANLHHLYGLDRPLIVQYGLWLRRLGTLDFGHSFIDDRPVMAKIAERLPATVVLNVCALFLIFALAVPIGVSSAVRRHTLYDRVMTVIVFIAYSIPTFWLALFLIYLFGFRLGWFPISGFRPWYVSSYSFLPAVRDALWHMVLPLVATSITGLAGISRYTRASMIEALQQEYIRTARAKGLSERRVIYVHALRNALLPLVTILGFSLPGLISGSVIFESIFSWPGMGRLGYEAVMNYDYPVIMGVGVVSTLLTLLGIFLSDLLYAVVDPRIRYER